MTAATYAFEPETSVRALDADPLDEHEGGSGSVARRTVRSRYDDRDGARAGSPGDRHDDARTLA